MPPRCRLCGKHHSLAFDCNPEDVAVYKANIRACAPELLRALEAMLYVFVDADVFPTENDTVDMARAAISKATGGAE